MTTRAIRDERWFEALFRTHHGAALGYARRRFDDPDDVVSEVFAAAWRNRAKVPDTPTTCATGTQPSCADYLAFEMDGRVLQAPLTTEPIVTTDLVVSGAFTDRSATGLAADYRAASVGLHLR